MRAASPGATSPVADARECERVVRAHARTFYLASHFLPPVKRRAAFALYAFCRLADDLVDEAAEGGQPPAETAAAFAAYERRLELALAGRPDGPVFRELARVVEQYTVPSAVLRELLDGVARDLGAVRYERWSELERYCEGVASSVGEMCTFVFGVPGGADAREVALRYARTLGVAMQLTNILRDVGEDAARGRCYLPEEDLVRFGVRRDEVLARAPGLAAEPRWRRLMAFEVARARALYDAAAPGISLLAPDAHRCARACAWGYAGILGAIEQNAYDSFSRRARLGALRRASVLWDVVRGAGPAHDPAAALRHGPVVEWDSARTARELWA